MKEHRPSRLHNALVVGKMETRNWSWSAPFYHSHVGGEVVLPRAKLVQNAVHLVYVETFRGFGYAVNLGDLEMRWCKRDESNRKMVGIVDLRMFPMILASLILITRFLGSRNSFISSRVRPSMLGISTSMSSSLTVIGCPIFDAENLSKKYKTHHVRRRLSRSTGLRVVCLAADLCIPRLRAILVAMPL